MKEFEKIAEKINVLGLINSKLSVPVYQRPYTWKKSQVFQLLDDLKDAMNTKQQSYLVGSIIVYNPTNEKTEIVDGQQRITTFSLILWSMDYKELGLKHQIFNHKESQKNIIQNYITINE
jgi:Uncharacterized conserved protein